MWHVQELKKKPKTCSINKIGQFILRLTAADMQMPQTRWSAFSFLFLFFKYLFSVPIPGDGVSLSLVVARTRMHPNASALCRLSKLCNATTTTTTTTAATTAAAAADSRSKALKTVGDAVGSIFTFTHRIKNCGFKKQQRKIISLKNDVSKI